MSERTRKETETRLASITGFVGKRCLASGSSMGRQRGMNQKTTCPLCGRKISVRPGRAGRLYPHTIKESTQ